jgi:hypothetical protein
MSEETKSPSSPQLALEEQSGLVVALTPKQTVSLYRKSKSSGIPFDTLEEVYRRGYAEDMTEQTAYNRVNSFIAGGAAMMIDNDLLEKRGLWDNIHAKRERIKHGSGEHMRKPGSKGAPTAKDFKDAQEEYTGSEKVSKNSEDASSRFIGTNSLTDIYKNMTPGQEIAKKRIDTIKKVVKEQTLNECNGNCTCGKNIKENKYKSETGGLTRAGVDKYNRENPGHHLKMAVTTSPSKLDPKGKAAGRRRSFCARMSGVKGPMKDEHGKPTRKALALRKWNC